MRITSPSGGSVASTSWVGRWLSCRRSAISPSRAYNFPRSNPSIPNAWSRCVAPIGVRPINSLLSDLKAAVRPRRRGLRVVPSEQTFPRVLRAVTLKRCRRAVDPKPLGLGGSRSPRGHRMRRRAYSRMSCRTASLARFLPEAMRHLVSIPTERRGRQNVHKPIYRRHGRDLGGGLARSAPAFH